MTVAFIFMSCCETQSSFVPSWQQVVLVQAKVSNTTMLGGPPDGTFVNLRSGRKEQRFNGGRIEDEHVSRDSNMAGTLSMANSGKPHTGGSQFFLNVADNTFLDWFGSGDSQHPVFGAIVSGYDVVVAISKVRTKKECPVHPVMVHGIMMS